METLNNDTYENSRFLKLQDYITRQNAMLVKDRFDEQLPKPLINCFKKKTIHNNNTNIQLTLLQENVWLLQTFVLI